MFQLGSLTLSSPLFLAPIAGYTDLAFRLVVRTTKAADGSNNAPVGLTCSELLCPEAIIRENDKTQWLAATHPNDQPMCMQLYGRHVDALCEAARWAEAHGAKVIDLNMGCPVDKVTKKNGGSKLLCEPQLAIDILRSIIRSVNVPVTAKIRLGWDDSQLIVDSLPARLADAGVSSITVHGRTTEQKFRGDVRLEGIARVVENVKQHHPDVKVVGNGDVREPHDVLRMLQVTGCDGVMIGRGALRQPWIFRDAYHLLVHGTLPEPLPRDERAKLVLQHFENLVHYRGERVALNTIRQRMSWYSQSLQPWPGLKRDVHAIEDVETFRAWFHHGLKQLEQAPDEPVQLDALLETA